METIFLYIAKVNIALAVFYLLYVLLLRNDTFIKLRRYYFLSTIIFSLSYPLFTVATLGNLIDFSPKVPETEVSVMMGDISLSELIIDNVEIEEITTATIPWTDVVKNILLVGILFFSLRFLWQLFSIVRIKWRSEKRTLFEHSIYHLADEITPFSFFNWIFIQTEKHSEEELKQILLHEQTHVKQWHSLDVMLVEVLRIFFWYNPIVWLMKRDITTNLEYLADNAVLQEGINTREYQYHLLQLTYHDTAVQIVNNFNVPQLKQRIMMMNRNKSPLRKVARYLIVLPLTLLLITANSVYAQENERLQDPVKKESKDDGAYKEKSRYHEVTENLDKLAAALKSEVKYPQDAKENGVHGDVVASFIIEEDGSIINSKIELGLFPSLNQEAIRVINAMPKLEEFTYTIDNEPLRVKYNAQFAFRLEGEKTSFDVAMRGYTVLTIADKTGDDKPLFIVDGVKMDKEFIMSNIDRSAIEHTTIYQKEAAIANYGDEGKNGAVLITTKPTYNAKIETTKAKTTDEVFMVVEVQPEFPGGMQALMKYFSENIIYPLRAKSDGIEGRVITSFIVNKDGSISDVEVVRSVDPLIDAEAIRVIGMMPKWKPGMQRGVNVNVKFTVPVVFRLSKDEDMKKLKERVPTLIINNSGSNKPLIIIDGEKMAKEFDLNQIKPEDIESISVLKPEAAVLKYADEGRNGVVLVTLKKKAKLIPTRAKTTDEVFMVVENQPEFPGGVEAMMRFLGDNIRYPVEAMKSGTEGRVITNFIINKDGSISDINIVRGLDPLLDAEAIRVISTMPHWKPGQQRGENVNVKYTLPIVFRLSVKDEAESEAMKKLKEKGPVSVVDMKNDTPEKAFYEFIAKNVRYPVIAQENGIMGVSRATYDVNAKGEVSNVKTTEGIDPALDAELIRVIKLMPKEIALMKSGGKAASNVEISASFRLQNGNGSANSTASPETDIVVVGYGKSVEK